MESSQGGTCRRFLPVFLYIGILLLAYMALQLPFNIYSTFVIEERFGFNKTTRRTFILDLIKGFFLGVILGRTDFSRCACFIQYAGEFAWLYCWAAVVVFSLAMQYVAPTWIMPFSTNTHRWQRAKLRDAILNTLVPSISRSKYLRLDGSKRSTKSNAFFTGFGNINASPCLIRLIAQHTVPEMVAVLAHEVGITRKNIYCRAWLSAYCIWACYFIYYRCLWPTPAYIRLFQYKATDLRWLDLFGLLYTPIELVFRHCYGNDFSQKMNMKRTGSLRKRLKTRGVLSMAWKSCQPRIYQTLRRTRFMFYQLFSSPLLQRIEAIQRIYRKGKRLNNSLY